MPKSKKRAKRESQEVEVAVKNPLKSPLGKAVVILLAAGFVVTVLVGLIAVIVQVAQM